MLADASQAAAHSSASPQRPGMIRDDVNSLPATCFLFASAPTLTGHSEIDVFIHYYGGQCAQCAIAAVK
jgi:hypothetical protein